MLILKNLSCIFFFLFSLGVLKKVCKYWQKNTLFFANPRAKVKKEQISSRVVFSILVRENRKKCVKNRLFLYFFYHLFCIFCLQMGCSRTFGPPFKGVYPFFAKDLQIQPDLQVIFNFVQLNEFLSNFNAYRLLFSPSFLNFLPIDGVFTNFLDTLMSIFGIG